MWLAFCLPQRQIVVMVAQLTNVLNELYVSQLSSLN